MVHDIGGISRELNKTHGSTGFVEKYHGAECFGVVEQLGLAKTEQLASLLRDENPSQRRNKGMEALLTILLAKMAGLEGNYAFALDLFEGVIKNSYQLNKDSARENPAAYFEYEYSAVYYRAGDISQSELHLERSQNLARSNKLKHIIEYEYLSRESEKSNKTNLRAWLQHTAYFSKHDMSYLAIETQIGLARHYMQAKDLGEAANCLDTAHLQALEAGYRYLSGIIELGRAEILILQDRKGEALGYLKSLAQKQESPFLKCRTLYSLASLHDNLGEDESALQYAKEAVELSLQFHALAEVSRASHLVGRIYHRQKANITKAFFYHQKAYGATMELLKSGITVQGERAQILTGYINFLEEHFPGEVDEAANEDLFAFSKSVPWVQIKDLFHYNLFLYHYMNTGVGGRTLEVLDFPASSFYSATERLRSRGIVFPNFRKIEVVIPSENYVEGLQQYCRMHREKTWVDINDRFEKDMLAYHYKLNNYNKKVMAKKLDLAYSGIVNRTQYLTAKKS